jgi:exodeoxyribonuclease VII large subunit
MAPTFSVNDVLVALDSAIANTYPTPIWIRGEVSGYKRTNRGAAFFSLVDHDRQDRSLSVAARAMVMDDVIRSLDAAKVGSIRDGIEVRLEATVGHESGRIRLSLLQVDPEFIAGRLALDREEILRKLKADGSLVANSRLPIPLVPLSIGLVTSVGSAAHADFREGIGRSGFRFRISVAEAKMQGEGSDESVVRAMRRLSRERLDMIVVARGGGSKLDLATFDAENLARSIAAMPVPVMTAIGHETDRSVADAVASVPVKTPTAAAEWLVARVGDFAARVEIARGAIRDEANRAIERAANRIDSSAKELATIRGVLGGQLQRLQTMGEDIVQRSRDVLARQSLILDSLAQVVATVGLEPTLRRGFSVVTRPDGAAVKLAASLQKGDAVNVRMVDGTIGMTVEEEL